MCFAIKILWCVTNVIHTWRVRTGTRFIIIYICLLSTSIHKRIDVDSKQIYIWKECLCVLVMTIIYWWQCSIYKQSISRVSNRYYFLFSPDIQIKVRDDENKTSSLLFSFQLMVTVNKLILLLSSAPNMLEQRVR